MEEEAWEMIQDLWANGLTISEISRRTGHDRKTVRRALQEPAPLKYKAREKKPSILEPHTDYIRQRLGEHPLSAVKIFSEIRPRGYTGGYNVVKRFVRSIKADKAIQAVLRYETLPGIQSQTDWSDHGTVEIDGGPHKVYGFTMVLGYSRHKYLEYSLDASTESFIRGHLNAYQHFGGFTKENLYDNTKNVVLTRALRSSDSKWNPMFEDFFRTMGFIPRLCKPYRPQTKGKVENTIKFERGNFLAGLKVSSLQELNALALKWVREVGARPHGTTGVPPLVRFEEERTHLIPLVGKTPYQIVQKAYRKISRDCYVSYLSNKYSVPWKYAGREATLLINKNKVDVQVAGEIVCQHELRAGAYNVVRVKEHFAGLYKEIRDRNALIHEKSLQRQTQLPLAPPVVQRSLAVYDQFCDLNPEVRQ